MQAKQRDRKPCVYCNVNNHKSSECGKVKGIQERKKTLSEKNCVSIAQEKNIEHQNAKAKDHIKYVKESITRQYVIKIVK